MANERLRAAMAAAHVGVEHLAERVAVDPKTVQRWLNGRVPHARHRWGIARLLGEDEHYLWPPEERGERGASPNDELVAAYTHRADVPLAQWWDMFSACD